MIWLLIIVKVNWFGSVRLICHLYECLTCTLWNEIQSIVHGNSMNLRCPGLMEWICMLSQNEMECRENGMCSNLATINWILTKSLDVMQYDSDKSDEDKTPIWTTGRKLEKTHTLTHREWGREWKSKGNREIERESEIER